MDESPDFKRKAKHLINVNSSCFVHNGGHSGWGVSDTSLSRNTRLLLLIVQDSAEYPLLLPDTVHSATNEAEEDLDALLRFQDPLEVVATCAEVGNPIVEIFLEDCLEEGRAEERFPLVEAQTSSHGAKASAKQPAKNRNRKVR